MAVVGIGVDIVEVKRVAEMVQRHSDRFLTRVFTPREIAYCSSRKRRNEHLAARWAAKEATIKALRAPLEGALSWRELEVVAGEMGEPQLKLLGTAAGLAKKQGISHLHLTISHVAELAVACVVAEADEGPR